MTVTEKAKSAAITTAVSTALNYLEKDPEGNIPKVMDLVDRLCPEDWYVPQRRAFREAIAAKNNWYQLILRFYELDSGVRKAFFQNFIINASLKGFFAAMASRKALR